MTTLFRYGMLFLIIFIAYGCEKELICGDSKSKGIITESVSFGTYCMNWIVDQEFVVDRQEELDSLYQEHECDSIEDPEIDFSKSTLLGIYTSGGGCNIQFIREVEKEEENKKYVYTIRIRECGWCDMGFISMNWVLVPKLPEGWIVKFIVSYE